MALDAGDLDAQLQASAGTEGYTMGIETQEPLLVSQAEAARSLGICARTLNYLIANKDITAVRIGSRTLIKYSSIICFAS